MSILANILAIGQVPGKMAKLARDEDVRLPGAVIYCFLSLFPERKDELV